MSKISIVWKKSAIGFSKDQKRTVSSLGLRRLNQVVVHEDTPAIRGMINKIRHLLEIKESTD